MQCPNCQTTNRLIAFFCKECGAALFCPRCREALPVQAQFCDNCGQRIFSVIAHEAIHLDPDRHAQQSPPDTDIPPATIPHTSSIVQKTNGEKVEVIPSRETEPSSGANLQQYIPQELLTKVNAARASGGMVGERRVVTMLFCDVKGSTAAAEQLDPEDWTEIINGAFEHMIRPVYKYEGTVARLMGDAILAFFGAPIAHEDDPERAILAGLDIVGEISPFADAIKDRWGLDFNVRVGINTGLVVVGAVGSDLRLEYTATGDAINLAARMEQTAQPGAIQISEDTYRLVSSLFEFKKLTPIEVKGKSTPVQTFRVLRRNSVDKKHRGLTGLEAPLIGRAAEYESLLQVAENLNQGLGGIVALIGEAGLGKSRLVAELNSSMNDHGEKSDAVVQHWFETSAVSYESAHPYGLFRRLIRQVCGIAQDDPIDILREKIGVVVAEVPVDDQLRLRQVFESIFGVSSASGDPALEGETFKRQLFAAMESLWARRSEQYPVVLACEDLHWADPASVELLVHLFSLTERLPFLILLLMRADRKSPSWTLKQTAESDYYYHHRYSEINVQPLSHNDSVLLVDSLVEMSGLSTDMADAILEKVEGNPLFAEEVVRAFHESQLRGDGHSENGSSLDIPDNLQALLVSRIDRLEDQTRRALQLAALIGRSFYYRILEMIADDGLSIDTHLAILVRADMIREAARIPELEYIFRHQLTQAAAYQTILLRERREFHQRVGEAIEKIFHDRIDEMSVTLVHHFSLADNPERALSYLILAGDGAIRLHAHAEAVEHYTKALEIALAQQPVDVDILRNLFRGCGRALEMLPDYDEALANYEKLGAIADQLEAAPLKLDALVSCATLYATQTPFQNSAKAEAFSIEALEIACTLDDPAAKSKIYWIRMMALTFAGENPEQARTFGEQSLAIAREHELHEQTAFTIGNLVMAYWGLDEIEPAQQLIREARGLWEKLQNLPMLVDTFSLGTYTEIMLGNLDSAFHTSNRMIEISHSIDNGWNLTAGTYFRGLVEFERGNYDLAVIAMEEVRRLGKTRGINFMYLNALGMLAPIPFK